MLENPIKVLFDRTFVCYIAPMHVSTYRVVSDEPKSDLAVSQQLMQVALTVDVMAEKLGEGIDFAICKLEDAQTIYLAIEDHLEYCRSLVEGKDIFHGTVLPKRDLALFDELAAAILHMYPNDLVKRDSYAQAAQTDVHALIDLKFRGRKNNVIDRRHNNDDFLS